MHHRSITPIDRINAEKEKENSQEPETLRSSLCFFGFGIQTCLAPPLPQLITALPMFEICHSE